MKYLLEKADGEVDFFEEAKIMGDLAFKFYDQGDSCDNVTRLSEELCQTSHKSKLLKDCYKQDVFHEIDYADILLCLDLLL